MDALVEVLWMTDDERWPSISLANLKELVGRRLEYDIASSTVRSAIYSRPEVFRRLKTKDGKTAYSLAASVKKQG